MAKWNKSKSQNIMITEPQLQIIKERNHLDIQLYKFALKIFEKRLGFFVQNNNNSVLYNNLTNLEQTTELLFNETNNFKLNF